MQALVAVGVPLDVARARVADQYDSAEKARACETGVLDENWTAVCLFVSLPQSCWGYPPMGGAPLGLLRDQVTHELLLRGVGRRSWPALWAQIQVMENEALAQFALRRK